MTSRPAVGSQQPPQQRTAARPRASVRTHPAQVNVSGNSAWRSGLTVDLSARGSRPASREGYGAPGGSGRASPSTPGAESPNRLANSQKGEKAHRASNGASTPHISGSERTPVAFPPRPGQYMPEPPNAKPSGAPAGFANMSKADAKLPTFEAPAAAQLYPQGSMYNSLIFLAQY